MGILAPLALAALPLLAAILALYLLKLRRPMAPVASLHLWESLTRDREANSLWQRLRVSILLVLQLLVLLVLILALARPWVASSEPVGRHSIIVVDVSASMGAADAEERGGKTRLQAAQGKAMNIVADMPQGGTATLISVNSHASVLVPASSDKARLRKSIEQLRPQASSTDMVEAVKLAQAMASMESNSALWILSDGAFAPVGDRVASIPAELHFVPFGRSASNQGISALSLQQRAGNLQLFAQVVNSSDVTTTRRLDLTVDDAPWTAKTLAIPPGGAQELVLEDVPMEARVVQAQLAGGDELALDDTAWIVNRAGAPANVLLVTGGNKFLEVALSLLPNVFLYKVAPGDYRPSDTINGAPLDLTLFDADVPGSVLSDLPPGNMLLIAPQASSRVISVTGTIKEPVPGAAPPPDGLTAAPTGEQGDRDPLLRFVDLTQLHISEAVRLQAPPWGREALSSDKGPLIVVGEESGRKVGVLAFDLHDTDLPVQTAFPLLMRNLIPYLLPDPAGGLPAQASPGTSVGIEALSPQVDRILVEDPSPKEWPYLLTPERRRIAYPETAQPGIYYVSQYAGAELVGQEAFAVNLFSRDESMINPNPSPGLPLAVSLMPPAPGGGDVAPPPGQEPVFKRELWPVVALAGFLLLLFEWVYAQRIAVRRTLTEWQTRRALKEADRVKGRTL